MRLCSDQRPWTRCGSAPWRARSPSCRQSAPATTSCRCVLLWASSAALPLDFCMVLAASSTLVMSPTWSCCRCTLLNGDPGHTCNSAMGCGAAQTTRCVSCYAVPRRLPRGRGHRPAHHGALLGAFVTNSLLVSHIIRADLIHMIHMSHMTREAACCVVMPETFVCCLVQNVPRQTCRCSTDEICVTDGHPGWGPAAGVVAQRGAVCMGGEGTRHCIGHRARAAVPALEGRHPQVLGFKF